MDHAMMDLDAPWMLILLQATELLNGFEAFTGNLVAPSASTGFIYKSVAIQRSCTM